MAKVSVSGGGGGSHRKTITIDTATRLAALVAGERVYTPDTVPDGYVSVDAVWSVNPAVGRQIVYKRLHAEYKAGKVQRVAVKVGQRREYWYGTAG